MRWTARRKLAIVVAYRKGNFREVAEVLVMHAVSEEEFQRWVARFELLGIDGLKSTLVRKL